MGLRQMKIFDAVHTYALDGYDGAARQLLIFMKREGPGYPFNVGSYGGTNCQEVMRALIDRILYLDRQVACAENQIALAGIRSALYAFEIRAARRHGRELQSTVPNIETAETCGTCGHIDCGQDHVQPIPPLALTAETSGKLHRKP
jgi:hypothetical protein